jgi:hypothetical protein
MHTINEQQDACQSGTLNEFKACAGTLTREPVKTFDKAAAPPKCSLPLRASREETKNRRNPLNRIATVAHLDLISDVSEWLDVLERTNQAIDP